MTSPPTPPAGFGAALYRLRAARGWSLQRAAREAGVSVTTVMRAERGHSIQLGPAIGLTAAYGTTVGALLDGTDESVALIGAARAWAALRRHAGAPEGSAESRQIARDVMGILCGAGSAKRNEPGGITR